MSYRCGAPDWIDLAIGRLEDAKRSLRECDRLRQATTSCDMSRQVGDMSRHVCEELRQARRCVNRALIMVAQEKEIEKDWSTK